MLERAKAAISGLRDRWKTSTDDPIQDAAFGEKGIQDNRDDADASEEAQYREWRAKGLKSLDEGDLIGALEGLGAARALRPHLAEAHFHVAKVFLAAGKLEAARRAMELAGTRGGVQGGGLGNQIQEELSKLPKRPNPGTNFTANQRLYSAVTSNVWVVLDHRLPSVRGKKPYEPLGGAYGAIYKVEDQDDHKEYALKTFDARFVWSEPDRRRFEREAATWLRLDPHPNIVTAFWVEKIDGFPCVVQEWLEGGDLYAMIRRQTLRTESALRLAIQFCDGMSFANETLGIVHRDVKPENCLLDANGVLKIGDFGLAQSYAEVCGMALESMCAGKPVSLRYTSPGGTGGYRAPEQRKAGIALDIRADIYSFGVMLYEMMASSLFPDSTKAKVFLSIQRKKYRFPDAIWDLILHCVEPDRDNRPSTFWEVRERLESVLRAQYRRPVPCPTAVPPSGAGYYVNKAVSFQILNRFDDALTCIGEALALEPDAPDLLQNQGALLHQLDRNQEAIAVLDRALCLAPGDADALNNRGLAHQALRRNDEALSDLSEAVRRAPRDLRILKNKANLLYSMRRLDEALQVIGEGLDHDPNDVPLRQVKAFVLLALGSLGECETLLEETLTKSSHHFGLWKCKAEFARLGRSAEALVYCARALEIEPDDPELLNLSRRLESDKCSRK